MVNTTPIIDSCKVFKSIFFVPWTSGVTRLDLDGFLLYTIYELAVLQLYLAQAVKFKVE